MASKPTGAKKTKTEAKQAKTPARKPRKAKPTKADQTKEATPTDIVQTPNRPGRKPGTLMPTSWDRAKALELKLKGCSYNQIAKTLGMSKTAIIHGLRSFTNVINALGDGNSIDSYEANRTKVLTVAELALATDLLDTERRQKASLNNTAYALGQVHSMRRLEEGKSTSNQAIAFVRPDIGKPSMLDETE